MSKIELINLNKVGNATRQAIEDKRDEINDLASKRAIKMESELRKIIPVKQVVDGYKLEFSQKGAEFMKINDESRNGRNAMAYLNIREPFYVRPDEEFVFKIEYDFNRYNIEDTSELLMIADWLDDGVKALDSMLTYLNKIGSEFNNQSDALFKEKRILERELNAIKLAAKEQNYREIIESLKSGIDLTSMLLNDRVNVRMYRTKTKDFYAAFLKLKKETSKGMVLEVKTNDRKFDYETGEYGEYSLGESFEVKVQKDVFLEDMHYELHHVLEIKERENKEKEL